MKIIFLTIWIMISNLCQAQNNHKIKVYISKNGGPSWVYHSNHESRNVIKNTIIEDNSMFSIEKLKKHQDTIHRYYNQKNVYNRVFFKSYYGSAVLDKFKNGEYTIKINYLLENKRDTLQTKNIIYIYKYLDYKDKDLYYIVRLKATKPMKHASHFKNNKLKKTNRRIKRSTKKLYKFDNKK